MLFKGSSTISWLINSIWWQKSHLISNLLQCLIHSGRLAQCLLQSLENEIIVKSPKLVKSLAIANLFIQFPWETCCSILDKCQVSETLLADLTNLIQILNFGLLLRQARQELCSTMFEQYCKIWSTPHRSSYHACD